MTTMRWITGGVLVALLIGISPCIAQEPFTYAQPPAENPYQPLTPTELEALVAPIALYPDPLIGVVLPASTFPLQIVQASRYLNANQGVVEPPQESTWDSSVIALLRYPDVLIMMDEGIDWTGRLGDAMYYQQTELLDAVQRVRERAQGAGHLTTNDKQVVVVENEVIRIEPAQPEVVYVPVYDPQVIYVPGPPVVSYSVGYGYGPWLPYTCDWYAGGFFFTNFYFGGHWHTHHSGRHRNWRPYHHPRRGHGGHHRGDWDGDHHGDDGHRGDGSRGDGPRGDGPRGDGPRGDGPRGGGNPDIVQQKTPREGGNSFNSKVPGDVIPRKVPKTDPSGYPIERFSNDNNSVKSPRAGNWSNVSEGKSPNRVGYDRRVQYDRKPNRTTLKIPTQNGSSSNSSTRSFKVPQNSNRIYQPKTQRNYKAPSYQTPAQTYKVPSRNYSNPSRSFKAPSAPSMKVPSSRSFSGGKGFSGGGKGSGGGRGGGKVPKGGR